MITTLGDASSGVFILFEALYELGVPLWVISLAWASLSVAFSGLLFLLWGRFEARATQGSTAVEAVANDQLPLIAIAALGRYVCSDDFVIVSTYSNYFLPGPLHSEYALVW